MAKVKPLNDTQIKNAKSTGKVGGDGDLWGRYCDDA